MTTMPISVLESICKYINTEEDLEKLAKEAKETEESERESKEKEKLPKQQSLEKPKTQNSRKTKGNGLNNKQKVIEGGKSSS